MAQSEEEIHEQWLVAKWRKDHELTMRDVFNEFHHLMFVYRGYGVDDDEYYFAAQETGLISVKVSIHDIHFNYCIHCGEPMSESQRECNHKHCFKCHAWFPRTVSATYTLDSDDEDDYDDSRSDLSDW